MYKWYDLNAENLSDSKLKQEGIYWIRIKENREIIYIGTSCVRGNIQERLKSHLEAKQNGNRCVHHYVQKQVDLQFNFKVTGNTLLQPLIAENLQVRYLQPRCNNHGTNTAKEFPKSVDMFLNLIQGKSTLTTRPEKIYWYPFEKKILEEHKQKLKNEGVYLIRQKSKWKPFDIGSSYIGKDMYGRLNKHLAIIHSSTPQSKGEACLQKYKDRELEFSYSVGGESLIQPIIAEITLIHLLKPECNYIGEKMKHLPPSIRSLFDYIQITLDV